VSPSTAATTLEEIGARDEQRRTAGSASPWTVTMEDRGAASGDAGGGRLLAARALEEWEEVGTWESEGRPARVGRRLLGRELRCEFRGVGR
jgi:hypothetical protein